MVVLPTLPSVSVTLNAPHPLPEHPDASCTPTSSHISTYVETHPGQSFSVRVSFASHMHPLDYAGCLWVLLLEGCPRYARATVPCMVRDVEFGWDQWRENGIWWGNPLVFKPLVTHEHGGSDADEAQKAASRELGSISIKVRRFTLAPSAVHLPGDDARAVFDGSVSEKALKGRMLTQSVLSTERGCACAPVTAVPRREFWDGLEEPFATYTFKYRSRHELEATGVVPSPIDFKCGIGKGFNADLKLMQSWLWPKGRCKAMTWPMEKPIKKGSRKPTRRKFVLEVKDAVVDRSTTTKKVRVKKEDEDEHDQEEKPDPGSLSD